MKLVTVHHDGWPKILAITTKNVQAGDRLWTDYGDQFTLVEPEKELYRKRKSLIQQRIMEIVNGQGVE